MFFKRKRVSEFIIDETQLKVGSGIMWLWIAIESETKNILAISISKERKNMFVAIERFLSDIVDEYGQHPVSTDDGGTWYPPQACKFLKLKHHISIPHMKKALLRELCSM